MKVIKNEVDPFNNIITSPCEMYHKNSSSCWKSKCNTQSWNKHTTIDRCKGKLVKVLEHGTMHENGWLCGYVIYDPNEIPYIIRWKEAE